MIIGTTCSVIENKMKKAADLDLESLPKFFVSDFSVNLDHTITIGSGSETVTFNDNVSSFSIDIAAFQNHIADVQNQLAQTANNPNLTICTWHNFYEEQKCNSGGDMFPIQDYDSA